MKLVLNKSEDILDLLHFYADHDCLDSGVERVIGAVQVPEEDMESFFIYKKALKTQSTEESSQQNTDNTEHLDTTTQVENSSTAPFKGIWTKKEDTNLLNLIGKGMSVQEIAKTLNRTDNAILARSRSEHKYSYFKNEQKWVAIRPKG